MDYDVDMKCREPVTITRTSTGTGTSAEGQHDTSAPMTSIIHLVDSTDARLDGFRASFALSLPAALTVIPKVAEARTKCLIW